MLAHYTVSSCLLRTGDLLGSSTISGLEDGDRGSLLEICKGGKALFKLEGGEERLFLQDYDTVNITGSASRKGGGRVGFKECKGTIQPAIEMQRYYIRKIL